MDIPFNKPYVSGKEINYIKKVLSSKKLSGNGPFTKKCQEWLKKNMGCQRAFLTHSCTDALEMSAILSAIKPGDEIIMTSYTFVSTANAFVLRGAVPVFVDIDKNTLNIDEDKIEPAITSKTKAISVTHYAGISCDMDQIVSIAKKYNLLLIEDAAQSIMSYYKKRPLGSIGDMGALSFHETKNITSGEGGSLLINNRKFLDRAAVIWEKGTDKDKFRMGKTDKYKWIDIGSSYMPGEIISAFLLAQMEKAKEITEKRIKSWNIYNNLFCNMEKQGKLKRPFIPSYSKHNAHIYYILLPNKKIRDRIIKKLNSKKIGGIFHYIPLHNSPAGKKTGRTYGKLRITRLTSETIIRLPLWVEISQKEIEKVFKEVELC